MRPYIYVFFLINALAFSGCKQERGIHEFVSLNEVNRASDEVYIRFLSNEIDRYPEVAENYIALSKIYERQNDVDKAIDLLKDAEKENPDNLDILVSLSSYYLQQGNIDELSKALKKIRDINPDHMDFLKLSAGYAVLLNDYTNAMFFVNRALLANPYDHENYYLLGKAQLINKDSLSALASFEEAYEMKPTFRNFSKVFDVSLALGNRHKVKQYLDEFSKENPDDRLCYQWGAYYNETGERDTAKQILMSCLNDETGEPRAKYELAKIYFNLNNIDSTLFYVNQYMETGSNGTGAYVLKAKTLEKINHYTEARKLYNMALEIDSTSILASRGLENLERKVAYLRLVNRKEEIQREVESLKPLKSKVIN